MSWCRWQKDCWINYIRILCTIMLLYDRILNFTKLLKILFFLLCSIIYGFESCTVLAALGPLWHGGSVSTDINLCCC